MLRTRIYYRVKPFIPTAIRTALRRTVAARLRSRVQDVWPIMPGSERPPVNWPGWPDGKKFALLLTHDVEGQAGLNKCRALMELEIGFGVRSSFNFIPEGTYRVARKLRDELTRNGFEVGVHDLKHDGSLYRSPKEFVQSAGRINRYLAEWNAIGFRSGFMLHNLDWLHELNIAYDASTFDSDPFEPQPEGRHTIFPFWLPFKAGDDGTGGSRGYVELPYTLPQDSTLFLLLGENSPEIWLQKVDWIAQHGGMALVNVHPDYLRFEGEAESRRTYPEAHYRTFLSYVRDKYGSTCWQPLPKELAAFIGSAKPLPTIRRALRVCMVNHSFYESDNRVTRYAEALVGRGDHVDVLALRQLPSLPECEKIHGVNLFRIQNRFGKAERSKLAYLWPLLRFLGVSSLWLTRQHFKRPYDIIHVHNVPDFLVFAAWYPKLTHTPIILDIHDIVPEFFASKFHLELKGMLFRLLHWMERASATFADKVIIANHLWIDKYASRTGINGRCTAFINNVDSTVFRPRAAREIKSDKRDKQIVIFPGGLQWHQGVDIAIRAFDRIKEELPAAEFHIYGDGSAKDSLVQLAGELGLNGRVRFFKPRGLREIAAIMAEADLGVVPKRADSFGDEAYSTKIMEFMSVGVPVVISNTKVDRYYFNDSVVRFFESGNAEALAGQMLQLLRNPDLREQMISRGLEYAAQNCWNHRKADYLNLVDLLLGRAGTSRRKSKVFSDG